MRFWPFRKSAGRAGQTRQETQIAESVQRIQEDGRRRVDEAQAQLTQAAEEVKISIGSRGDQSSQLRDALLTLIDRKSGGMFDLRNRGL